jgi:hypothetical protein
VITWPRLWRLAFHCDFPPVFQQFQSDGAYFVCIQTHSTHTGPIVLSKGGCLIIARLVKVLGASVSLASLTANSIRFCVQNKFRPWEEKTITRDAVGRLVLEENNSAYSIYVCSQPKSTNGRIAWAHDNFRWLLVTPPLPSRARIDRELVGWEERNGKK